jgi:MFS family permease
MSVKADARVIFALALVHFTGDFYASFLIPLLPVFTDKMGLTLTQVGFLAGFSRFLAFVVQPSAGYIADRYQTRFFVLGGPLLASIFMSLMGIAPSYLVLLHRANCQASGYKSRSPSQIHRLIPGLFAGRGFRAIPDHQQASDARRRGATSEAYRDIRRKEKRTPARLGQEGNAADDVLMVDQGHHPALT